MSMNDLIEAFNLIEQNKEKGLFGGARSEELCQKAEQALGIKFPPTYRLFIKKYGTGGIGGVYIYGPVDDDFVNSSVPDVVWVNLEDRKKWNLPHQFIIIDNTGDGDWYALDSSKVNSEGEYPVVICCYDGEAYHTEKIYEDFGAFLLAKTQLYLEDDEDDIG